MVHLCVSITDNAPRLESVQEEAPVRSKVKEAIAMDTLQRQPRSRTASSRQNRGSCPVISGPYSDQEDEPLMRRQSSPILQDLLVNSVASSPNGSHENLQEAVHCLQGSLPALPGSLPTLQGSLSSFQGSLPTLQGSLPTFQGSLPTLQGSLPSLQDLFPTLQESLPTFQGSLPTLQGSLPSLQDSFPSLQESLPTFQGSLPTLQGSLPSLQGTLPSLRGSNSGLKRYSSLEECSSSPSTSLRGGSGSSSEDDSSWDTSSWSSGATCMLRTPAKQHSNDTLFVQSSSGEETSDEDPTTKSVTAEPDVIYQNLIFPFPTANATGQKDSGSEKTQKLLRKDSRGQSVTSASSHQRDQRAEDRLRFSQFLNEVTCRVINGSQIHPLSTLRHRGQQSQPPPVLPSTSSPPSPMWCGRPSGDALKASKKCKLRDFSSSVHQWSKSLPSCKVLEPGDVLSKMLGKGGSYSSAEHDLALCTKIQAQPSTGRFYLETDIDRVRQLDELVANGSLGKEKKERGTGKKTTERGKEMENRQEIEWERGGESGVEQGKQTDKDRESQWGRDKGMEKGKEREKGRERSWERDRGVDRGRDKENRRVRPGHVHPPLPPAQVASNGRSSPCPAFSWPEGFPRMSYRSTSLPRPLSTESDGEIQQDTSSFHDHKDDLRKRLSYTTHKLEMVETEFDSTRQYLETELRRAQEELEKFTDKLRRIQNSYAALQRINQDLEDKVHRTSQHHEEEKRALSREVIVLNNHLMEAKITIDKLREDNELYRKDCNLAAQLLQCSKSHYRAHKMSELPLDFQERVSSHMEKQNRGAGSMAMPHSAYPDAVPTSIIAKILEKPEPGSSCLLTRSPSPQLQDGDFLAGTGSTDQLNRRTAFKTSDLYCSDTALYCPERWQDTERRQSVDLHGTGLIQLHAQNSTDSNPDEEAYPSGSFSHHEPPSSFHGHDEFGNGSLPASSSYSSFSIASDEKGGGVSGGCGRMASSTLSSSHHALYVDWRDAGAGDYERKGPSSYDKNCPRFPKSHSIQHMVPPRSPQKGSSPAYTRTASCFSEPYHSSTPRLAASHSMGSAAGLIQAQRPGGSGLHIAEDELSGRWRQLSVEDINTFSSSYRNATGRVSPYSFSERHFAMGPANKTKVGPIYSSFQEGDDVFHSRVLDECFAMGPLSPNRSPNPSPSPSPKHLGLGHRKQEKASALYRAKDDSQDSECSFFLSGSSKEKEGGGAATAATGGKKDYMILSADSSAESLHQSSLEASSLQHYPCPRPSTRPRPSSSSALSVGPALPKKTSARYQKFGSTGLTRKDSLTKAQLYGTLLN